MKALFADLAERSRQQRAHSRAYLADVRAQVLALFDAVQVALAKGQHDRVSITGKRCAQLWTPHSLGAGEWDCG